MFAEILTEVFEDESLVPSDILAGLILLSHKARREKEEERVSAGGVTGNTVFHNMGVSIVKVETEGGDGAGILEIVREGERIRLDWSLTRHFYSYAAASYGYMWWLMQVRLEHSHWSDPSRYCALIGWDHNAALICHKDTAQGSQSLLIEAFLASPCVLMAEVASPVSDQD